MVAKATVSLACLLATDAFRIRKKKLEVCGEKGASAPSAQIINGDRAGECEWRWQAQLQTARDGVFCGGTLIDKEWVLTAAHCLINDEFNVTLGGWNTRKRTSGQQERGVAGIFKHIDYNSRDAVHDLGLVKLSEPVTMNKCVGTACLPKAGADVEPGTKCWVSGWGTTVSGEDQKSRVLRDASMDIVSSDDCQYAFRQNSRTITDDMLCAAGKKPDGTVVDTCQGDSGGPLVCENQGKWTVYGATSWGRGCGRAEYPGVYSRVQAQLDWIEATMSGVVPTRAPQTCNEQTSTGPDPWGDCMCSGGRTCYERGYRGCPYSGGGFSSSFHAATCKECECRFR